MRPKQFPFQPSPQAGVVRMPQNPQMMMQQQQQQQLMFQQQQRILQQQNTGLNAAIRELQQKTQQNQHHPLSSTHNSQVFQRPPPIAGPRITPALRPDHTLGNSSSGSLVCPPPIQNKVPKPTFGLSPMMNSNVRGTNFINQPPPGFPLAGHPVQANANNFVMSLSPGANQLSAGLPTNHFPHRNSALNPNAKPFIDGRFDNSNGRDRDTGKSGQDRSKEKDRSSGRNDKRSGTDKERFSSCSDSTSSSGNGRSRESSKDRGRSKDREKSRHGRYHGSGDRKRDSGRSHRDDGKDGRKKSDHSSRDHSSRDDRHYSRDRRDRSDHRDSDHRDKTRPSTKGEMRNDGGRSDRWGRDYSEPRDRDQRSRRRGESELSVPRSDRNFVRSPGKRKEEDDGIPGLSQYRQDLMKAELEKSGAVSLSSFSTKRLFDDLLDQEGSDLDLKLEEEEMDNTVYIIRSCPADLYFSRDPSSNNMDATKKMLDLEKKFEEDIIKRSEKVRTSMTDVEIPLPPAPPPVHHHHHHHQHVCAGPKAAYCESSTEDEEDNDDDDDDDDDEDDDEGKSNHMMDEWERRKKHPLCLHPELWYNEQGRVNDGPLCRCSIKSRKSGIRHDIYPGEEPIPLCNMTSNNSDRLHHYRVTMSPYTNFLTKTPTLIKYDDHEYIFEGFSLFTHTPLENIPPCKLLRFNIEYTIHFIPESPPENFTIGSLNLFSDYLFQEVLELLDLDWGDKDGGCRRFHFMPRFCRSLPDSGCKELLSMNTVLNFLIKSSKPLVDESKVKEMSGFHDDQWRADIGAVRGIIVTKPGMKPSSIRIDQLDRSHAVNSPSSEDRKSSQSPKSGDTSDSLYPLIIHQGYRPAQLSYAGDPLYRRAWKQYVKFRHLLNSKPKIYPSDKQRLKEQEDKLQEICMKKTIKREVTVEMNSKGFLCTGLRADLCQHALMIPVLMSHLRFHICLGVLEERIGYKFKDRTLLQLALTHTSYRTNYGTNPDHTRNSLTNCGMRQVEYGDRRVHYQNTRKRGICILLDIMSRFGKQEETISEIPHNERLEFLGDAVIEFLTSVHLFFMFPWLEEGGLSTYRMALVQNQHLAQLARKLHLQDFMLYVHGPDLCHESDLRHAMANCCEALMGSLFLDGGLEVVDSIFSKTLFDDEGVLLETWNNRPKHVLQQAEPGGDRHWVKSIPVLQKLQKFEESIGVKFNHIRLLAKAFTHRNIGDNPLTLGHNQRLEFLGDTVLQLVASEYLYRHYPEHHEGHLSLLRSSLVNSRTQAMVYDDIGMSKYVIFNEDALTDGLDMKTKQRADMLEAFIGALYVDKGLEYCWAFCNVCFFPRLKDFILNQDWNDPKSQLQQCCLTLREVGGGEPDIPIYKVIESIGPTNTRKYIVAVYFRGRRLATGSGHSIQQSEMAAATNALKKRAELFPILQHQRRFLEKMKQGILAKQEGGSSTGSSRNHSPRKRRRVSNRDK